MISSKLFHRSVPEVEAARGDGGAPAELEAHHLRMQFSGRSVVNGVSLDVGRGEIVGLLGPNGAGKTVTFSMLVGALRPTGGRVFLDGVDITDLPLHERARRGLGYLPQARSVFRGLTTAENIAAIGEMRGLSARDARERASTLLREFSLTHVARSRAAHLSGGEQRRLEVARSLTIEPRFLLFDEPFAGIDPLTVEVLHRIIVNLKQRGIGVLLTDHNVYEALSLCDRGYVLFAGTVLAAGSAQELTESSLVRRHFLGESFAPLGV